jgi:hypothetical protein
MSHDEPEFPESQPLLVTSSPDAHTPSPGRKQGQWVACGNQPPTPLLAVLLFSAAVIFAAVSFFAVRRSFDCPSSTSHTGIQFASPEIKHFWGAYTPYFSAKPYIPPPSHCQITQVRWLLFCFIFSSLISE